MSVSVLHIYTHIYMYVYAPCVPTTIIKQTVVNCCACVLGIELDPLEERPVLLPSESALLFLFHLFDRSYSLFLFIFSF